MSHNDISQLDLQSQEQNETIKSTNPTEYRSNYLDRDQAMIRVEISDILPSGQCENPPKGFEVNKQYFMYCGPDAWGAVKAIEVLRGYTISDVDFINTGTNEPRDIPPSPRKDSYSSESSGEVSIKDGDAKKKNKF